VKNLLILMVVATFMTAPMGWADSDKPVFSMSADQEALKITNDVQTAKAQAEAHPDDPEAHFLYAAALSRSPYLMEAFQELKKTKEILKQKQDFEFIDRTLTSYNALVKADPDNTVLLYRVSLAYFLKGYSIEKYASHFKNVPTGTPQENYDKARVAMERVIELDPKDTAARNCLGYIVSNNGRDLTNAIKIWHESIAVDGENNPGAYLMLSQAYMKQGDLGKAMQYGAQGLVIKQRMGMTLP